MAKSTPEKKERNERIVELKKTMTFANLARMMNISEARAKELYYRELKRRGLKPRRYRRIRRKARK